MLYGAIWSNIYNEEQGGGLLAISGNAGAAKIRILADGKSVSFLWFDAEANLLYALCETNYHGEEREEGGEILVFSLGNGEETCIGRFGSGGAFPIQIEPTEAGLLVLNHGSNKSFGYCEANLALFERKVDGTPGALLDKSIFTGSGTLPFFQESDAPHSLHFAKEQNLYYVPERGSDRVSVFRVDPASRSILKVKEMPMPEGSGPRNMVTCGNYGYVLTEIEAEVLVVDLTSGEVVQICSTLPESYQTEEPVTSFAYPHPSAIALSPGGDRLVTATRACDTLAAFRMEEDGRLGKIWEWKLSVSNPRQLIWGRDGITVVALDSGAVQTLKLTEQGMPASEEEILSGIARLAYIESQESLV